MTVAQLVKPRIVVQGFVYRMQNDTPHYLLLHKTHKSGSLEPLPERKHYWQAPQGGVESCDLIDGEVAWESLVETAFREISEEAKLPNIALNLDLILLEPQEYFVENYGLRKKYGVLIPTNYAAPLDLEKGILNEEGHSFAKWFPYASAYDLLSKQTNRKEQFRLFDSLTTLAGHISYAFTSYE